MSALAVILVALAVQGAVVDLPDFPRAAALYRESEFEDAIVAFARAAADPGATDADRAVILVWIGLCHAGLGDAAATRVAFIDALKLDGRVALPAHAAPKMQALFEELRAKAESESAPTPAPPPVAAPSAPPPVESAPPAPPEASRPTLLLWAGAGALTVAGAGAAFGAAGMTVASDNSFAAASDPEVFQDDAKSALDRSNVELAVAAGLGVTAVVLVGGGVVLGMLAVVD